MSESREAVKEALAIEAESIESVEAARAEQQRGESGVSVGLLLEAINKERESLDLMEQGIEDLRQAIEDRRRALEQQQELITQLVDQLENADAT